MSFNRVYSNVLRKLERAPATWGGTAAQQEEVADMIGWAMNQIWQHTMWSRLLEFSEETVTTSGGRSYVSYPEGPHVYEVYPMDPRSNRVGPMAFMLRPGEISFKYGTTLGTTVFVEARPETPQFTRVAYDGATTYATGDLVYSSGSGECYKSLADANTGNAVTDATKWELQRVPAWMEEYLVRQAFSELLRNDGRGDRADIEEARANLERERLLLVEESQQSQHREWAIRGR